MQTVFIEVDPDLSFSVYTGLDPAFNNRNFCLLKFSKFIYKGLHTKLKGKPPKTYDTSKHEIANFFVGPALWIRIGFLLRIQILGAKPMGIQENPDSDPGQTLKSQNVEFLYRNNI
jgi:hypothetical protein